MRRETARRRSGARGGGGFRRPSHDGAGGLQGRSHELGVVFLVVLLHGPASARAPMCVFSLLGPQPSELLEGPLLQFYSLTFRRLLFPDGPPATVAGFREAATREGAGGQPVATPQRAGAPKDPGPVGVGCLLQQVAVWLNRKVRGTLALVKEFHTVRATFTLDYVRAFLAVARDPGKGPTHYGKTLGIKQERASKILLDLAGYSRNSSDRLDLLKYEVDPSDYRARCYFLSGTGRELKERALAWLSFNE